MLSTLPEEGGSGGLCGPFSERNRRALAPQKGDNQELVDEGKAEALETYCLERSQ